MAEAINGPQAFHMRLFEMRGLNSERLWLGSNTVP